MFLLPLPLLALVVGAYAGSVTDYAPRVNQPCPTDPLIRVFTPQNQSLHPREQDYVNTRLSQVIPNEWKNWVGNGTSIGYSLDAFGGNFSKIGIAVSGGGYRAAQFGAGVFSGLDARNESAKAASTGGLLQVSSYWAGLSGGSWLTGGLYMNDWPTVKDMVFGNGGDKPGWMLDFSLASPDGDDIFDDKNQEWYGSIIWSIMAKADLGINFFSNDTAHGAGQLWSNIPLSDPWQQHIPPFPIIMADSRPVGSNLTTALSPDPVAYEITPMEFGSFDPKLSAMMNLSYAGTHLNNGQPDNDTACVTHFDQAGFVMGSSASLFNQILDFGRNTISGFQGSSASAILYVLSRQLQEVRTRADDVANWPSPFQNVKQGNFEDSSSRWLELIDGSSNGENVPLGPMFVNARGLDVVLAVDASADALGWPNGSSPLHSASRIATLLQSSHQDFPPLPASPADFLSTGVNMRPTFFGCDPAKNPPEYPMVIYFPNSPPLNGDDPVTNSDTFQLDYTPEHTRLFIDQVHANTIGGFQPDTNSPDPNFGRCLQCAALDRARYKTSPLIQRSDFCATCFKQYCFDPSNPPSKVALPNRKLAFKNPDPTGFKGVASFLSTSKLPIALGFLGAAIAIGALIGFLCWRKKRQVRVAQYKQVAGLHEDDDGDEAPFAQHGHYPRDSTVPYGPSTYEMPYIPPETRDPYQMHHSDSDMPYVPEAQQPLAANR
ncbi:hypothetical protein HETIRDRAFT_384983 [Heterobasidion irregulare TC 32-1]|uniref:Lysophospholipase n=1 Tax=Heterobasidion irregulare (strain TC 32-1) TaxID=747525 RepID=W4K3Y4_HETIT|nr:uncharacterized protein HETIRDRAFT_384983 [Heterobasidion irregulare TC 32-1]ETW80449.1 hypothetical protein HETIRDRAFT_384983 [Heterobasidion irregulare TC 32-1]